MAREKLVIALADLHCGHVGGITPPSWWFEEETDDPKRAQWAKIQRDLWNAYAGLVSSFRSPDVLLVNGDLIDGRGERTGGTELVTTDLEAQCRMAAYAIEIWGAFQSLLGRLKTLTKECHYCGASMFQSLLGRLKTFVR